MGRSEMRVPANHRMFMSSSPAEVSDSDGAVMNLSDTVFEFLDDNCRDGSSFGSNGGNSCAEIDCLDDEDGDCEDKNVSSVEDDRIFWENQHQLLRSTLYRTSSLETKIRNETKEAMEELKSAGNFCSCGKIIADDESCRNCLMREVCTRLRNSGFNCSIAKSKWRSSSNIPSGEHNFLDVIEGSDAKKGEVRIIIELNFRGEFEMNRLGEEYERLTRKLPEVFVGKVHRLESLIKIICSAGKKCMKEKKMHIGPWRKQRYMLAKWLGPCQRTQPTTPLSQTGWLVSPHTGPRHPITSMLTMDMLEVNPPTIQCQIMVV